MKAGRLSAERYDNTQSRSIVCQVVQSGAPFVVFGDGTMCKCNPISEADLVSHQRLWLLSRGGGGEVVTISPAIVVELRSPRIPAMPGRSGIYAAFLPGLDQGGRAPQ